MIPRHNEVHTHLLLLLVLIFVIPPSLTQAYNNPVHTFTAASHRKAVLLTDCEAEASIISTPGFTQVCKDGNPNILSFTQVGSTDKANYLFLLSDTLDNIAYLMEGVSMDFDSLVENVYRVYGLSYIGEIPSLTGKKVSEIDDLSCAILSSNTIQVRVERLKAQVKTISDFNGFGVSCFDAKDGQAEAMGLNGIPPYRYIWDDGQNKPIANGLTSGNHTVLVSDARGCRAILRVNLTTPTLFEASANIQEPKCQNQQDGFIKVVPQGGVLPYAFSWSTGSRSDSIGGLGAGDYLCLLSDANGCEVKISERFEAGSDLEVQVLTQNVSCFGKTDGSAVVIAASSYDPLTYNWGDGSQEMEKNGLAAGLYTVEVSDGFGCSQSFSINIDQPDSLTLILNSQPDEGEESGSAQVTVIGGTPPFQYQWNSRSWDTLSIARDLAFGTYQVQVSDANGCMAMASVQVAAAGKNDCFLLNIGFSPNGDGVNEYLHIPCADGFPQNELIIVNRWGQELFREINYNNSWDGSIDGNPLPDGIYYYILRIEDQPIFRTYKGTVSIIR